MYGMILVNLCSTTSGAASSTLVQAVVPSIYYMGVLLSVFAIGAGVCHFMLRRQRELTRSEYESRVVDIEAGFRSTEEVLRSDARAAAGWSSQARALRSEVLQLNKERDELRKVHPKYHRLTFNIGVIGRRGTGKTGLCLRLTDPLFHDLNGTQTSPRGVVYEHQVVTLVNKQTSTRTEHYFRYVEWGGEFIIEAQNDLLRICDPVRAHEGEGAAARVGIQALVLVVDLAAPEETGEAGKGAAQLLNPLRIREQIDQHFDARSLQFIINPTLKTYLQTVVVFINKADVLPGSPKEQEEEARRRYHDLLINVGRIYPNFQVIVGSVSTDAGLLKLYSHLVERILPDDVKKQRPLGRGQDLDIRGGGSDDGGVPPGETSPPSTPAPASVSTADYAMSNQDIVN